MQYNLQFLFVYIKKRQVLSKDAVKVPKDIALGNNKWNPWFTTNFLSFIVRGFPCLSYPSHQLQIFRIF